MVDTNTTQTAKTYKSSQVKTDKTKSAEQYIKDVESLYIVPKLIREKFPDLIKLIYETESMNEEEREYWLQIMPIMTEEQIVKFRDILVNERDQLAKLDAEYKNEMSRIDQKPAIKDINETELKTKIETIKKAETLEDKNEKAQEEDLLKQLGNV